MNNNNAHKLWVEKYRPKSVDDYVFHNPTHAEKIREYINNQTIPHLLFAGVQGSGKTTIARILIDSIGVDKMDVLTINASSKRGIETFRDDITNFAAAMPMGDFKVIHLEEADRLTPAAQDALKSFMEDASDYVRFILTCNRVHMIEPPIRSRCHEYFMKPSDQTEVLEYLVTVLASENVKFSLDTLDEYVEAAYPDVRKIVNLLQQNTVDGKLKPHKASGAGASEYKPQLLAFIDNGDWESARALACSSVREEEWDDFYTFIYDNIGSTKRFAYKDRKDQWEEAIVLVNEHLYMNGRISAPHVNAAAFLIKLGKI